MKKHLPILCSLLILLACALCACSTPQTSNAHRSAPPTVSSVALHSGGGGFVLTNCTIQTLSGYYLTAVDGGGRITDVIHTDATRASSWETFTLYDAGFYIVDNNAEYAYNIQTLVKRTYLTAVGGGGRTTDVIHSDATIPSTWETFTFQHVGGDLYALRTSNGNYLTAVDEGGRITDTIHSDATRISSWEEFHVHCDQSLPTP